MTEISKSNQGTTKRLTQGKLVQKQIRWDDTRHLPWRDMQTIDSNIKAIFEV